MAVIRKFVRPAMVVPRLPPRIAVGVVCHQQYIPSLPACLTALDVQTTAFNQKFLALDGCELSRQQEYDLRARGWQIRIGQWKSPNPGRQWALGMTDCEWIMFVDADDVHDPSYLAGALSFTGDPRVGIVYADRARTDGTAIQTPAVFDYWRLRLRNYIDTSSLWRTDALREAGGWKDTQRYDDWDCALRVTALGWSGAKNTVRSNCTVHPDHSNRNARYKDFFHKWNRTYGVVSLLAGRRGPWEDWKRIALNESFPPRTHWYLLDNSKDPVFGREVRELAAKLEEKGYTATVIADTRTMKGEKKEDKHRHVATLYNRVLPAVMEDLVLFWEDDVLPFTKEPIRTLVEHWDCWLAGGICALYESRDVKGRACVSMGREYWHDMPSMESVRGRMLIDVGHLPGGLALYNNALVQEALPFWVQFPGGRTQGWDTQLSRTSRAAGQRLDLDGFVECEHRTEGTGV